MQQDELARLFAANLTFAQSTQPTTLPPQHVVEEPRAPVQEQTVSPVPIVYASRHYTHSYHVAPLPQTPATSTKTQIDASDLADVLRRNSVDPDLLFPSQMDLFQNADDGQRLRLLELWRISPPQKKVDDHASRHLYDWPPTSLAQEEAMAKMRYESMMQERAQAEEILQHEHQMDQSMDQVEDSGAVGAARNSLRSSSPESPQAEPYIVSGYDMLARREYEASARAESNYLRESTKYNQATDPVYNLNSDTTSAWNKGANSIIDMENKYGAFAHARDHDVTPIFMDEEMVM